ncbi:MAG: porin [Pseudomonadota bacterium]
MNKHIALALLALSATAVHAQSQIKIYGVADVGLVVEHGGPAGNVTGIGSGVASGSRLGFKGTEDLGGGLAANFVLESGISYDTGASGQGGLTFGRQSNVGLSGKFGALTAGRQYSPYYKTLRDTADPFADGLAGTAMNIFTPNTRIDNAVEYVSPTFADVTADVSYGFGEVAGDSAKKRTMSAAVSYAPGQLKLVLAHNRREDATATDRARNTLLAARYKFGMITGHVAHAVNRGLGTNDSRDTLLGLCVESGPHRVATSAVLHNDRTGANKDAHQYAVAYLYGLSKRSDLYTAYGHMDNRNGATFKIGNATEAGSGNAAFNLGMRHIF